MTWRAPSRDDWQVAWLWAFCAASALLLRPFWLLGAPLAPRCLWHAWTGVACPTCGATRALTRLLHADLAGALAVNPLVTVAALGFVVGGLAAPIWIGIAWSVPELPAGPKPRWAAIAGAAVGANWAWLIAHGI